MISRAQRAQLTTARKIKHNCTADDDYKLKAVVDICKKNKRGIPLKAMKFKLAERRRRDDEAGN
jgi:uncharacterized protein YajQ (UPF0234 family)